MEQSRKWLWGPKNPKRFYCRVIDHFLKGVRMETCLGQGDVCGFSGVDRALSTQVKEQYSKGTRKGWEKLNGRQQRPSPSLGTGATQKIRVSRWEFIHWWRPPHQFAFLYIEIILGIFPTVAIEYSYLATYKKFAQYYMLCIILICNSWVMIHLIDKPTLTCYWCPKPEGILISGSPNRSDLNTPQIKWKRWKAGKEFFQYTHTGKSRGDQVSSALSSRGTVESFYFKYEQK